MSCAQKPSIGRVVTYWPVAHDPPELGVEPARTDHPAIITRVEPDGEHVCLTVFYPSYEDHRHNVPPAPGRAGKEFGDGGADWPPPGTWRWPERV